MRLNKTRLPIRISGKPARTLRSKVLMLTPKQAATSSRDNRLWVFGFMAR